MIELTRSEALNILLALSKFEGFLNSVKDSHLIFDELDYPIQILSNKLTEEL